MDVKWIEQGSSEWTLNIALRYNKWQTTELKIGAGSTFSSAQVKHRRREKQGKKENRGSLKSPIINWKLIWKLKQHQAPTHSKRLIAFQVDLLIKIDQSAD